MPLFSRILRYAYSFYAVTDQIATVAKGNDKAEFDLIVARGASSAARSMTARVAGDPISLEERLQQSFRAPNQLLPSLDGYPTDAPLPAAPDAHRNRCAVVMSTMFVRSLGPNGLGIASLPRPTTAEITACGFPNEKEFLKYFAQRFIPEAVTRINALDAAQMTLSKKEKEEIGAALESFKFLLDPEHKNPIKTADEFAVLLKEEEEKLEKEEGIDRVAIAKLAASRGGIVGIPPHVTHPPKPGSRRAAIVEALKLKGTHPELFEQRFACIQTMGTLAQNSAYSLSNPTGSSSLALMANQIDAVPLINPTFATCIISGDDPAAIVGTNVLNNVTLDELRNPTTGTDDEKKRKRAIAAKFDEISTTPDLRNEQVNKLDGEPVALNGIAGCGDAANAFNAQTCEDGILRQQIWNNRAKLVEEFLKLLPSAAYQLVLRHTGELTAPLTGRSKLMKVSEALGQLEANYTRVRNDAIANGAKPEEVAKKQAALDLTIALKNLANAILAENRAMEAATAAAQAIVDAAATAAAGTPTVGVLSANDAKPFNKTVPPTAIEARHADNVPVFNARNARIQCEHALAEAAKTYHSRIKTKIWNAVYERSSAHNAWEQERARRFAGLDQTIIMPFADHASINVALQLWKADGTWKNNSTNLNDFIDTLAISHGYSARYIQVLKAQWEANKYKMLGSASNKINNTDFPAWLYNTMVATIPNENIEIANESDTKRIAAHPAVANTHVEGALALPMTPTAGSTQTKRKLEDRPYVAAYVDFANAANNPAGFLVSKEFMIGLNGGELTLEEAWLKWMDLLIRDVTTPIAPSTRVDNYWLAAGKPASPAITPQEQKRIDVGGDLGNGRLSSQLNSLHGDAAYSGLEKPEPHGDGTESRYIVELDKNPKSPFFTIYRATIDLATGDVKDKKPITMGNWENLGTPPEKTWVPTPEGLAVGKILSDVYKEGMEASSKLAFETQLDCGDYVEKSFSDPNSDVDVSKSPQKPKEEAKPKKDERPLLEQHYFKHNKAGTGAAAVVPPAPLKETFMEKASRKWKNFKPFG